MNVIFKYELTNPELTPPTTSFIGLSHFGPLSTCPHYPRARDQTNRDSPSTQSLLKLFKLANSRPAYIISPIASCEDHHKCSSPQFLLPFCLLGIPPWGLP